MLLWKSPNSAKNCKIYRVYSLFGWKMRQVFLHLLYFNSSSSSWVLHALLSDFDLADIIEYLLSL